MAQQNQNAAEENRPIPSQAEGEDQPGKTQGGNRPVPSQAEGDEATVDEALRKQGGK